MTTDATDWAGEIERVYQHLRPRFARAEMRIRSRRYLLGLLGGAARKNGWQLAEAVGERTPHGMQDLLNRAVWDAEAVRDDLRAYVVEHLGDPDAVLVVDETGFLKKGHQVGRRAAPVQRHGGTDRELPDRGLPRLCQSPGAGLSRPGALPAAELGGGRRPAGGGGGAGGRRLPHQARRWRKRCWNGRWRRACPSPG